jgi:drug/metabolite transporter (DMT)-like permease
MTRRQKGLLFAFLASLIYGVTFTIAKDVMKIHIPSFALTLMRVSGAMVVFWLLSFFFPKEKVYKKDYIRFFIAAMFGIAINMMSFLKGLSYTSPISASVLMITAPIFVMIFSFLFLKNPINKYKVTGVLLGMIGATILIMYGKANAFSGSNPRLGNMLVALNAISYALYLILAKPILNKYSPITFAKWLYTFGFLLILPFSLPEFLSLNWQAIPLDIHLKIAFVVFFSTVLTYLFNLIALKELKPTTMSVFIYLQPLIASIFAIFVGADRLSLVKIISAGLILIGVYLVNLSVQKK